MPEPHLVIAIPDKSFGFVPGQRISIDIHVIGLEKQTVRVRFAVNDPLGATRFSFREVERNLDGGHTVLPVRLRPRIRLSAWRLSRHRACPFRRAELQSHRQPSPSRLWRPEAACKTAFRLRLATESSTRATCSTRQIRKHWQVLSRRRIRRVKRAAIRTAGGAGARMRKNPLTARRRMSPWAICMVIEALGNEQYGKLALGGLDYLLSEQEENGAFRWWYKAVPGGVMNQRDNFYDTGWAGLALAEGVSRFGRGEIPRCRSKGR